MIMCNDESLIDLTTPADVTLHEEFGKGDMGGPGSLHRLVRGLLMQRALKRDEFISAELTNHLFQSASGWRKSVEWLVFFIKNLNFFSCSFSLWLGLGGH